MQGEAVLGLEAAARSLVQDGTPCLNIATGPFGKGFGYWLAGFGAELHEIETPYDEVVTGDKGGLFATEEDNGIGDLCRFGQTTHGMGVQDFFLHVRHMF